MAKVKAGDKVAYTPMKTELAIPTTDGKVLGVIASVDANAIVLETDFGSFNVSKNTRRFKKLTDQSAIATAPTTAPSDDTVTVAKKPGTKTAPVTKTTKTKSPRPGSKKYRAIVIYKEVNGDSEENLDRTTVKKRFEAELELGTQGSSTYYQNIKSRQNGWWF